MPHQSPHAPLRARERTHPEAVLVANVLAGLRETPKRIAPVYFYDALGSALFDQICELPEYYLTRTETQILRDDGADMADQIGENVLLVEFGSGSSIKTRLLLDRLRSVAAYVPVDISRSHLLAAARRIASAYPQVEVLPVCADFTKPFTVPAPRRAPTRIVVFFPGSTIGNFDPQDAVNLLGLMRDIAGQEGGLLLGADLVKDAAVMVRAYDDAAGVTAAFNRNVLQRFNNELDADFDVASFRHHAVWNAAASRIEMHLVSTRRQRVTLAGESIELDEGERIVTEHCHKYTLAAIREQARHAGWAARRHWLDSNQYFSLTYLEAVDQ